MLSRLYGYYSSDDVGRPGQYLETFKTSEEAEEFQKEFQNVPGRYAWIETDTVFVRQ